MNMEDRHIYQLMLTFHEQLRDQKAVADEGVLLVHAMKSSLVETVPGFEAVFDKHYRLVADGALGRHHAATMRELDEVTEELRKLAR